MKIPLTAYSYDVFPPTCTKVTRHGWTWMKCQDRHSRPWQRRWRKAVCCSCASVKSTRRARYGEIFLIYFYRLYSLMVGARASPLSAPQACRTEAEYAFQQRKLIVPLIMESGYKATGWLGALMGTRLYFDMSDATRIPSKVRSGSGSGSVGGILEGGRHVQPLSAGLSAA